MNKNIVKIAGLIMAFILVIIGYLTYLQVYKSQQLLNHPRNRRSQIIEEAVARGRLMDRSGKVLAYTVQKDGTNQRVYPYGEKVSGITGYISRKYGRWGLEAAYNWALLGVENTFTGGDFWALRQVGAGGRGNDVVLSLDIEAQETAYRLLGGRKGAVVAVEPSTGRVLALVSRPGFDPAVVEQQWEVLRDHPDSPLLNRAVQGLYPPGSTFKLVTGAGILGVRPDTVNRVFDAPGYITVEGRRIEDKQARGKLNLSQSLAVSSNYVFATLGLELGAEKLVATARGFGFGQKIPIDLTASESRIPQAGQLSKLELAETAIGQGRVLATPLNMALVAAGVANGGKVMAPTLVDEIRGPGGKIINQTKPKLLWTPMDSETAAILREMMVSAVAGGTGRQAAIQGVRVAGKTGSAQNPHGQPHAWFVGFAPAEKPAVAVAVIVENAGAGGSEAAPIARELIKTVMRQER